MNIDAMNIIVGFVLFLSAAFLAAWAWSPQLRARIEKPNQLFQRDAQSYDAALQAATITKGGKAL